MAGYVAGVLPLYALAIFSGAALLFLVEPLFARLVLPVLGGTPAVWNTALVFYQATLLLAYLYVHLLTRLGRRAQVAVHLSVAATALIVLPVRLPLWDPPTDGSPVLWLLAVLAVALGLPFFTIATTSPLLQHWFARAAHARSSDPYFLYAASNLGSMIGLLAYPLVVEPRLRLAEQSSLWSIGYLALVALLAAAGALHLRAGSASTAGTPLEAAPDEHIGTQRVLRWVALAAVPSSLMVGVTTYLQTDLAPMPLLWIAPLTLYLGTFILAFGARSGRLADPRRLTRVLPYLVIAMTLQLGTNSLQTGLGPGGSLILVHLVVFTVAALLCHAQLSADRPGPRHLTAFYLWIALGGVLGGSFNALLAPLVFSTILEYPVALVAACLLAPALAPSRTRRDRVLDVALPLAVLGGVALLSLTAGVLTRQVAVILAVGIPCAAVFAFSRRPLRFGLGIAAVLAGTTLFFGQAASTVRIERSFFGIHRVAVDSDLGVKQLHHGSTLHGVQRLDPARRLEPTAYYHPSGPYGQAFQELRGSPTLAHAYPYGETRRLARVAVVGLGSGGMACLGAAGEQWDFYEIDPVVERIARQDFTFLAECAPRTRVILGDGRLQLARSPERYDVIALDAFSSDAIPVHLLTSDAVRAYLDRLAPGGVIMFHISNRHLDLEPVLANIAAAHGLATLTRKDIELSLRDMRDGKMGSHLLLLARERTDLRGLLDDPRWQAARGRADIGVWTDDFSSLLPIFRTEP